MAKIDFITQLQALNYTVSEPAANFLSFEYEIPCGRFEGRKVFLALEVHDTFPMSPPPGPHFKEKLLPVTGHGGTHPYGAIHNSPLGSEWQYWSRPFREWNKTGKTVEVYLAHIRNLLATIP
jgi:hypothetical protein